MVVPEGWEVVELISLSDGGMQNGLFYENNRKFHGIPIINVSDMYNKVPIVSQGLELFNATHTEVKTFAVNDGDLFFTRSSVVPNGIAFCNWYKQTNKIPVVFDSHVIRFKTNKKKVLPMFLYLQCISKTSRMFFLSSAKTATMTTIDQIIIGKCPILRPPLSEQRRIAEVLSDTDAYISSLKKLIAKKEAVKQGVMQELLTGKKRLPGFSGEWVEKRLGDVIESYDHLRIPVTENLRKKGQYPYYGANGIQDYVSGYTHDGEFVLIAEDGANNLFKYPIFYINARVWVNNHTHIIKGSEKIVTTKFLSYVLKTIHFYRFLVGGTRHKLNGSVMYEIIIIIPPTLAEQTAIANVLSDMDEEIEALKKKLKKVEFIKQGMMQKLLTGDIRLLEGTEDIKEESLSKPKLPNKNLYVAKKVDSYKTNGRHSKGFDDAVMIAGIVNALYSPQYPLGRKKLQKCLYLLRRYQEQSTEEFKKKAAGPYADEIRYKGGEPIAIKSKYIISHKGTKGTMFSIGNNIKQAMEYINRWNMQADIEWVKKTLKFEKVDKLELWATVDMAICDLKSSKIPISVASIKNLIATNKEWSKKLEKPMFSDKNIADAITILQTLFIKG